MGRDCDWNFKTFDLHRQGTGNFMEPIDLGAEALKKIIAEIDGYKSTIITEEDTRLKVLDRVLIEVLGWKREDIYTEKAVTTGYIDYFLANNASPGFILEAKKISHDLGLEEFTSGRFYKLNGPVFRNTDCQAGLTQAKRYCQAKSVQLACLTSGNQWVIFLANRIDGKNVDDGYGLVFASLKDIEANFALFWTFLSRDSVLEHNYQSYFREQEGTNIRHKLFYQPVKDATRSNLRGRSRLATDLEPVFTTFFQNITGDTDKELLFKCFVESNASRDADAQLQTVAASLLDNLQRLCLDSGQELQETIEGALKSARGEFVLILGAKGSGKSTFVERFFAQVLRRELFSQCTVIRIDFRTFKGDFNQIHLWIEETLLSSLEKQLFKNGVPEYEQLQGIFWAEHERWRKGEFKHLYESNQTEFKIKFGEYLFNLRKVEKGIYLERLFADIVKNRHLMPCLIFDNIDHFGMPSQDEIYQHARAVFEKSYALIIFPTTDRTIWQLSKQGAMQSYFSKCFSLPTPSPKAVIGKRINYLKTKIELSRQCGKATDSDYFMTKGIRVTISDLEAFAACLEELFINTDYVARWIGMLANFDIRRCLELCHNIICSPYIPIDDLITSYISRTRLAVKDVAILLAIIKGRYYEYLAYENNFVHNTFCIDKEPPTSPLIKLRVLQLLKDAASSSKVTEKAEQAYLAIDSIQEYFTAMNIGTGAVRKAMSSMLAAGLIESFDPTQTNISEAERVRISHSGVLHLEWSTGHPIFISSMAEISPISEETAWNKLNGIYNQPKPQWRDICETFTQHLLAQDALYCLIPAHPSYEGERYLTRYLAANWKMWFNQKSRPTVETQERKN